MAWDYSIYPELTDTQKHVFSTIGETLYMIQLAEHAIKLCGDFAFSGQKNFSLEKLYSNQKKDRKRTLGQLLTELRKIVNIHPQFDSILKSFVEKRNFFAHNIFNDPNYGLVSDETCKQTEGFLLDLQDDAWNVQNVFMGVLLYWAKVNGIYEHFPKEFKENKHLQQVQKQPFHLLFNPPSDVDIEIRMKKQNPQFNNSFNTTPR